jgi:hypothetical protein
MPLGFMLITGEAPDEGNRAGWGDFLFTGISASTDYLRYHELRAEARAAAQCGGLRMPHERAGVAAGDGESYLIRVSQQRPAAVGERGGPYRR